MPAIITSLITTGFPGDTFTLNGSGFGVADPDSFVYLFPNVDGLIEDVTGLVTTWVDGQIIGSIPVDLTEGASAYFTVQLLGETTGVRSDAFSVGPPLVVAAPAFDLGTPVGSASPDATDTAGDRLPVALTAREPVGRVNGIVPQSNPREYVVLFTHDVAVVDESPMSRTVVGGNLASIGGLSRAAQEAAGMDFYPARRIQ